MIESAFLHLPGIGPKRAAALQQDGMRTWRDLVQQPQRLPGGRREAIIAECHASLAALENGCLDDLTVRLHSRDRWRILHEFLEEATFFDIETTGLDCDAEITVIACWHRGQVLTFVEHENLDEFLDVLEETRLLVSFNGNMFDVPRVLNTFHIPQLPCGHLDLRWMAHHVGHRGGLKRISQRLGIVRPADLWDVDGAAAVQWWWQWRLKGDESARSMLIRYCAADVLLLQPLAAHLAQRPDVADAEGLWSHLPPAPPNDGAERRSLAQDGTEESSPGRPRNDTGGSLPFGQAAPSRLRARRVG